ncbi:MAG: hypothetical protein RLP09_10470 [Sandaracinaceae bacterium]|nr:MAG: hypothetical protein EVA89_28280 [Sandaracinaceae bacterium]HBQ15354.1 hypothetical protein [Myxococcales bacterium]
MGFDYAFFALLFAVATTLAPADAREVTLVNGAHPDETLVWTRGEDARWALTVNGRDVGHFRRDGAMVVHETGQRAPDRFPIASLVDPDSLRRGATRLPTKGSFAPAVITVSRQGGRVELSDASREVLYVPLLLRSR